MIGSSWLPATIARRWAGVAHRQYEPLRDLDGAEWGEAVLDVADIAGAAIGPGGVPESPG
jgi:hypothetical protein